MSKKVLVVDDDPDVRTFNVAVLEENGYEALVATNGEEGMELVKKHKPDLLLLDVLMPRESGIRMYREIKTDLEKPVDAEVLAAKIKEIIG